MNPSVLAVLYEQVSESGAPSGYQKAQETVPPRMLWNLFSPSKGTTMPDMPHALKPALTVALGSIGFVFAVSRYLRYLTAPPPSRYTRPW